MGDIDQMRWARTYVDDYEQRREALSLALQHAVTFNATTGGQDVREVPMSADRIVACAEKFRLFLTDTDTDHLHADRPG